MLLLGPLENVDIIFDKHVYQNDNVRQVSGGGVLLYIVHCFLLFIHLYTRIDIVRSYGVCRVFLGEDARRRPALGRIAAVLHAGAPQAGLPNPPAAHGPACTQVVIMCVHS